jgi:hypothetical protein
MKTTAVRKLISDYDMTIYLTYTKSRHKAISSSLNIYLDGFQRMERQLTQELKYTDNT